LLTEKVKNKYCSLTEPLSNLHLYVWFVMQIMQIIHSCSWQKSVINVFVPNSAWFESILSN